MSPGSSSLPHGPSLLSHRKSSQKLPWQDKTPQLQKEEETESSLEVGGERLETGQQQHDSDVPGTVGYLYLILTQTLRDGCCSHSHFTAEETKAHTS